MTAQTDTSSILIIDDTPSNLSVVVSLLEGRGHRVSIAQDGEEGLQRAQLVHPDLILLDVMMPGMDGFETCRRLKMLESTRNIPVIFMTALASGEHKVKGFEVGGVDYVTKPLQIDEVMARVETHLKLHTAQRRLAEQNAQLDRHREELEQRVHQRTEQLEAANQELRESEQRYRLVFENSPVSIWEEDFSAVKTFFDGLRDAGVTDIAGYLECHPETVRQCAELVKIIDVNQAALTLHEAASKEELFAGLVNTFTPESFATFRQELVCLWNGETGVTRDAVVKTLAGELRHVTVHFGICPGYEASYAKVLVSLVDITARKLSEDALRESEEKYRTLIQKIQAGVIVHGADTRILIVNPVAQEILGLSEDQLLGKAAIDPAWHFFREDGNRVTPGEYPVSQVLASRQALKNCVLGVHRPGSDAEVWCLVNADPVFGKDGEIIQVIVTFIDITQRKHAEQVLAARELEFRTLAENAPNIIMRYDRDCRRVYVNPAYERETAISQKEAVSTMPVEEYKAALRRAMESGEAVDQVIGWLRRDGEGEPGEIRYHALRIVAERDPEGKVTGALVIGHNITALKEAERKIEEAYQQVQELAARREEVLEAERKRIARDMHDELGQYLTAMRMGVSLLRMRFGEREPDIMEPVQNVMSLVDRTIQVVRSMATRLRPAPLEMGVVSALEWLAEDFSERSAIACNLDAGGGDIAMSDNQATALFRIVQESLTNVARYADAGSVEISLESDGQDFRLRVRDDGKGFDSAAPRQKSYGLVGIRERAAMLGGEANIASVPGLGTTIEIRIPIREAKGQP